MVVRHSNANVLMNLPGVSPGVSVGKLFNFISRACPPGSSRGDSKEKAIMGAAAPQTPACHSSPQQAVKLPGFFQRTIAL